MDLSKITDYLYIAAHPQAEDAQAFLDLHLGLIISMIHEPPAPVFTNPPFSILVLKTHDSILLPIPIDKLVQGVETALPVIQAGQPVLVFCRQGRHRSVAMASCILIGMGYSASEAMRLVKEKRSRADPYIWYIQRRIRKFEKTWVSRPLARIAGQ
jgi:protein tyrosine phosphatase (PTP) superfamily phosphohydrolase (DUF442 family)